MTNVIVWNLIELATTLFEVLVTYMFFNIILGRNNTINKNVYNICFFAIVIFSSIIYNYNSNQLITVATCLITRFLYALLFEGKIKAKILYSIVIVSITALSEIITFYLLEIIINIPQFILLENGSYRLAGIIISKVLMLILVRVLCMIKNYKYLDMPAVYWLMLISTPVCSLAIILILSLYNSIANSFYTLSLITTICILYIDILVFYLFDKAIEYFNLKAQNRLLEQQSSYELKYYQNSITSVNEIKRIKHDMKNHLQCISELIRAEKFDDAEKYINSVADVLNVNDRLIQTKNAAIDAILNAKFMIIKDKNIELSYSIEIPSKIDMEPMDICVILGNSIDNAIEACDRIENGPKNISIILTYRSGSLILSLTNTTNGNLAKRGSYFLSSKNNHLEHGLGLSNIERTVKKYNGVINLNHKNNVFEVMAILYNV